MQKEFNWVIKVLESSLTFQHVDVSIRLFSNFLKKWGYEISNEMVLKLTNTFDKLMSAHKTKIKKNLLSSINYN